MFTEDGADARNKHKFPEGKAKCLRKSKSIVDPTIKKF